MLSKIQIDPRKNSGQVTLEYFIIFAVVAGAVIVGFGALSANGRNAVEDLMSAAARKMADDGR